MRLEGLRITVIGAGIGGLAAARALALRGADVTVLEQAEAIREVGAGLQISPNGACVLHALGLPAEEIGLRGRAMVLRDHAGRRLLGMDLAGHGAGGQGYFFCHRADLVDRLACAARAAGVKLRLLQRVEEVQLGDRPAIRICNSTIMRPDLIIGADGLHSRLRSAILGDVKAPFTGQVAWRALVPAEGEAAPEVQVFTGPGRHAVVYPLRGGTLMNIVAVEERRDWVSDSWSQQDDPDNLRRAFRGFSAPLRALLDRVEQVNLWGLHRHPVAARWHQGPTALLGDAAHPTLPFLAQGANLALEDAWVLAEELAGAESIESGLGRYQARRHGRVTRAITTANGNAWKYHLRFPPLRLAAHTALRLGDRFAGERMLRQFDWLYAHDVTGGQVLGRPDAGLTDAGSRGPA